MCQRQIEDLNCSRSNHLWPTELLRITRQIFIVGFRADLMPAAPCGHVAFAPVHLPRARRPRPTGCPVGQAILLRAVASTSLKSECSAIYAALRLPQGFPRSNCAAIYASLRLRWRFGSTHSSIFDANVDIVHRKRSITSLWTSAIRPRPHGEATLGPVPPERTVTGYNASQQDPVPGGRSPPGTGWGKMA